MAVFVPGFHIEKRQLLLCRSTVSLYGEDGTAHTEKRSKNLFHPQMKFYNDFQKSVLVMAVFVPGFHIENRQLPFVRYTLCP